MSRPHTILGLVLRLASLEKHGTIGCGLVLVGLVLCVCAIATRCGSRGDRIATFNIRDFPEHERQVEGAFAVIRDLDAPIVAVQEITDPEVFEAAARARLGEHYRFVHSGGPLHRVGLLYDSERFALAYARVHDEVRLTPNGKPALEVRLRRTRGAALRVFVVHLKAGGDYAHVRREQLRQLAPIVSSALESWDEVIVLGDFNATSRDDRETLAGFARATRLVWASEDLECTSYWSRRDGCLGVALDHVLTRSPVDRVDARGPCEEIGCSPADRCPAFHHEVSDHCPVTVDLR